MEGGTGPRKMQVEGMGGEGNLRAHVLRRLFKDKSPHLDQVVFAMSLSGERVNDGYLSYGYPPLDRSIPFHFISDLADLR